MNAPKVEPWQWPEALPGAAEGDLQTRSAEALQCHGCASGRHTDALLEFQSQYSRDRPRNEAAPRLVLVADELIGYMRGHSRVQFATHVQIAQYAQAHAA